MIVLAFALALRDDFRTSLVELSCWFGSRNLVINLLNQSIETPIFILPQKRLCSCIA